MALLTGKTALVTGASRGIGRAIALALAAEGAAVAVNHKAEPAAGAAVVRTIGAAGGQAIAVAGDVSIEVQVIDMFRTITAMLGGLDIVVNNAGVILEKPLLQTAMSEFDELMGVNLRGTFMVGREALRHMSARGRGGRLINIASDLAFLGRECFSVYAASKGAVISLTKSWAREFAPAILVNAVAPGPVDTDMLSLATLAPEWRRKEEGNPLGRVGRPEEIAAAVVFLAGPAATFMVGQVVGPNGGSVMP